MVRKLLLQLITLTLLCANLTVFKANAQIGELKFKHLKSGNGLQNSKIYCIFQDYLGYIWIGTEDGLHQYDGISFKIFNYDIQKPGSLASNVILQIFEDSEKNLWIATNRGLDRLVRDKGIFEHYPVLLQSQDERQVYHTLEPRFYPIFVTSIFETSEKQLLVFSGLSHFFTLDKKNKCLRINNLIIKDTLANKIYRNAIGMCQDNLGRMWYYSNFGAICKEKDGEQFKTYSTRTIRNFPDNTVRKGISHKNEVWLATSGGLVCIRQPGNEMEVFRHSPNDPQSLAANECWNVFADKQGYIWVATDGGGISILNPKTRKFSHLKNNPYNPQTITENDARCIFEDKQGNFWIGFSHGGVSFSNPPELTSFKSYYNVPDNPNSLSCNSVTAILKDKSGKIWIGTDCEGIDILDPKNGKFSHLKHDSKNPNSLGGNKILTLLEDKEGNIWAAGYHSDLNKIDPTTGKITKYGITGDKTGLSHTDIRDIYEDPQGNLWIATNGGGVNIMDNKTKQFTYLLHNDKYPENTICGDYVMQIKPGANNKLWFGTYMGLSCYDTKTKTFSNYWHWEKDENTLSNDWIFQILTQANGDLWVGTNSGLNYFNAQTRTFTRYSTNDGLINDVINGIQQDKQGNLWLATNKGLCVFNPSHGLIKKYDINNNLPSNQFMHGATTSDDAGNFYFGTNSGLIVFHPDSLKSNPEPPRVYINSAKYSKEKQGGRSRHEIAEENILGKPILELKQEEATVVSFYFSCINFINSAGNRFACKLEGFDKEWNMTGNTNNITYTNLDPGEYVFRVKACNNDGVWNDQGASIIVRILPPWWGTTIFRVSVLVILISLMYGLYIYRIKNLQIQQILLEEKVEARTGQLSAANKELLQKNEQISLQNDEIRNQNQEINSKTEEINSQKEILETQKDKIERAYRELSVYHNHLEEIVKKRTHELESAKYKAEESDRLKSSFLANLSHEIRTPLNAIVGFSRMLAEDEIEPEEKNNVKSLIISNTSSLLNLINDIIDFSKIEAGQLVISEAPVNLGKLFSEIYETAQIELKAAAERAHKNVEFRILPNPAIFNQAVITDENRLKQILINLIGNAIKFTSEGFIEVGCKLNGRTSFLEFSVRDTGIGIKPAHQQIIFERFRKVEEIQANVFRGAGLGLSICKQLLHLLGGEIYVISEQGRGSTFYFTIPYKPAGHTKQNLPKSQNQPNIPDLSGKQILVAEDDNSNFLLLERMLRKTKAQISHAKDGLETVNMFAANKNFDFVLMDLNMPELNGFEALERIRQINSEIIVIAQTAHAFTDEIRKIDEAGFSGYVLKPLNSLSLYSMFQHYL